MVNCIQHEIPASRARQITSNLMALNRHLNELSAAKDARDISHAMQGINDTLALLPDPHSSSEIVLGKERRYRKLPICMWIRVPENNVSFNPSTVASG
jgi:hypothetical protein